jgi:hypothetical protein
MLKLIYIVFCIFFDSPKDEIVTKIYNIQDLEIVLQNYNNSPELSLENALRQQSSTFKNSNNSKFIAQKDYNTIIGIIKANIEPDIWYDQASIQYWHGNLIIRAPQRIHDQIK